MAENVWTDGAATGVWTTGANWSLGHKPAAGEDVVLNSTQTSSIIAPFDADGDAVAVRSFHRHPNYTGDVGTSGDPLVLATQAAPATMNPQSSQGKVIVRGPGKFYYINGVGGATQRTDTMYIDTDEQATAIEVNGAIDRLNCLKGRITALSGFSPATIAIGYRTNPATDVHLTLQNSAGIALISQQGGTIINTGTAAIGIFVIGGGTFDHGISAGVTSTLYQTGGLIIHRAATTISLAVVLGGTLDLSQDGRAKTVAFLQVFPGATFKQNANITITEGGTILPITNIVPQSI